MAIDRPLKVLSLYEGFFVGGARIIHSEIIKHLHLEGQKHSVLSLTNRQYREYSLQWAKDNFLWQQLEEEGLTLTALDRDGSEPLTPEERATVAALLAEADVILSLKEQPLEIIEGIPFTAPLVVSLHRSDPEHQGHGPASLLRYEQDGRLTKIVCCAHAAKHAYAAVGIREECIEVIPNGIDLERYKHDGVARQEVREELGISPFAPVVMLSARFDEMKNVPLFLSAADRALEALPGAHFILCGSGLTWENPAFVELSDSLLQADHLQRLHPLGVTNTIERYYSATDVIALTSSFGEAAPLCLLEGMACGAIPVATDVGDTVRMVGDKGIIVESTPEAVAAGWAKALHGGAVYEERIGIARKSLGNYSMVESFRELLESVAR